MRTDSGWILYVQGQADKCGRKIDTVDESEHICYIGMSNVHLMYGSKVSHDKP